MHTRLPLSKVAIAVLAVIGSPTVSLFSSPLYAVTLQAFNPVDNDQLNGNLLVTGGAVTELTGNQQFAPGVDGSVNTTLGALQGLNRIVNDHGVLGANRLDIGPANFGITIPDPTTGGNTTFQVYNPASLVALAPIDASTSVADVVNVQDNQYINTRIADVNTGGTLNVNIGKTTSAANAATNAWTMAAKQSTLFNVDGTSGADSTLNWNSNNRITFTGTAADPTVPRQLSVQNLMTYNGAFTVQTVDGATNSFNVTNTAGLKTYNDWLITQLKSGNLDKSTYLSNFNKAFIRSTNTVDYLISADDPTDDVAQSIGNRIVINATGANAKLNVAAGKTLEVIGANGGAIRGSNGAEVTVNGKVSSSGSLGSEGSAVYLDASSATNNGVINGGFINRVDGTGVGSAGFGSNGVQVQNGSTFDNNGIVNFATTGGTTAAVNLGAGSAATNSGNINVGVNGSSATGSTSGVLVGDATASFINNAGGMIYLGRGPQNSLTDSTADTAVNQSGTTAGVQVTSGGSAINNGSIVLGSRIQNGAGMLASGGTGITMLNNGNIDVTGKATAIPRENIAMSVLNASGNINNAGIINLTGVNATGVKVVATQGNTASATSTGTINVAGGSDPASGTRNYGVWVEGQGTGGTASASVDGPVNLTGNGAIGVHARGNATVDVASTAIPTFSEGSNQIGFFAFGPNAKINSIGNNAFDVTTTGSTMFRLEQGADFDGTNLTLTSSGANSVGVLGTGTGGTVISSKNATFEVSGNGATGMVIEGGATGSIDTDTTFNLSGTNAVAAIADGQRHTLAGTNTGSPVQSTALTSAAVLTASGSDSMALISTGANARINTNGTRLIASGTGARAVTVEGGAQGNLDTASSLTLSGTNSIGGVADGQKHQLDGTATGAPDASTTLTSAASLISSASGAMGYMATNLANVINNGVIALSGAGSSGMTSQLGGTVTSNNQISLTGADSTGLSATQNGVATNNSALILSGANSTGISATQNGIAINNASVDLSGIGSTAARLSSGSTFSNNGTLHVSQGTGIDASGGGTSVARAGDITVDNGIAGVRLSDGTQLVLTGTGNNITTSGTAHGVLLDTGAAGLSLNNTTLNINGTGSGIENRTETGNVTLQNTTINVTNGNGIRTATSFDPASTLRVNVNGSGTAFNFTNADLSTTSGALTLGKGYVFNVTGAGGTGINANTTGDIVTSATVNVTDTAGGSALVAGTAGTVLNTGVLTSASLSAPVVDLSNGSTARFENRGIITPSSASAVAVSGSAGNDDVLLTSGNVFGDINTGAGDDTITWNGGTLDGSLSLGAGNANRAYINDVDLSQTRHITSGIGEDNQVSFSQIVSRGGTFDTDDLTRGVNLGNGWNVINFVNGTQWELTGDLKLAHSNVNIDSTSTLFAGNGVNPTISGGEVNSAIVTNAGLIDLTNGSGSPGNSLTINGDLVSDGGTVKMITNLNEGGVLSNQFTDSLRITGNASSGTTLLDLTAADVSTGKLTDLNHSSTMDAYEGISLVQVGGNASAGSFALKGGYLAAGPWRYDLYSFAPGASDANQREVAGGINNTFWDYRIGNAYVCQGDDCNRRIQPAAVTPTNPGTPEDPSTPVDTASTPLTNPPDDGCVVNGIDNCAPGRPAVTPQVPSYISAPVALAYYNASIIDDLHKRLGELRHEQSRPDGTGGEMFLRYIGSNMTYKSNVSFKQFGYDFDMDYSAVQVGGNVLRLDGDKDSLRGGLAYTHGNSRMRPKAADGFSSTTFDSDSIALYLTWQRQNGFYMDGVLSFDNHRGQTDIPRQQEVGSPKAKSWSASLESGYPFLFDNGVKLEPQAQLMYTRINMDNFTDKDSTTVDYQDYSQTIGRAGLRADRTWIDETGRQYTPYLRANYYRGWGGEAKTTIGAQNADISQTFASGKFGQMGELGGGGTITFKNDVSLYAEVDYRKQINSNGAKGWGYTGGVRWTF
ncbi:autotransporter outer membrane beta-barrel domain-containing protein [Rahnella inusitata]|uniref:autotransporter outer membrane beta-barrel domain-containing protein n=1 Tax=Rahnella inusitata TaxID=58169 RepID=UPI0039BE75BD